MLQARGVEWCIHYIDDFLTAGPPESDKCHVFLALIKAICEYLGFPLHEVGEGGGTGMHHRISWHNLGFYSDGSEATRRESTATTGSPQRLVHETRLQEKRIALTYWQTCPCMQSGSGGKTLPTPDDRAGHSGKEAKPLDSSNRRVQGRPRLVASFPASVEPKMHDASAEPLQRT